MKKMNKLTVAAFALAAIGLASTAASAQVTPGAFDLVLGFQLAGNSTDLEVDLGPASNFTATTPTEVLSQLNVNDLIAAYTSSWSNATLGTGVNWSVTGINAVNDGSSFYATSTAAAASVRTSSTSGLQGAFNLISSLAGGSASAGSLNGAATTANSSTSADIGNSGTPASSLSQSYQSLEGGNGFTFVPSEEATGAGSDELYSFVPGTKTNNKYPNAADIGKFTLGTDGTLTFTGAQAVPEPSAYALGICAAVLFLVLRRRASVV